MSNKMNAPVVISRKYKKTRRWLHLITFGLTGGMSAPLNAAVAASNADYNRTTRKLAEPNPAARANPSPEFSEDDMVGIPAEGRKSKAGHLTAEELAYMRAHRAK